MAKAPKQKLLLDRYRVIRAAGTGGFATVYEALDTHLNRTVAIKVFDLSESDVAGFHLAELDGKIAAELEAAGNGDEGAAATGSASATGGAGAARSNGEGAAAFPDDPDFLAAREERLAMRAGASLRKKPNFEELAHALDDPENEDAELAEYVEDGEAAAESESEVAEDDDAAAAGFTLQVLTPESAEVDLDDCPAEYFDTENTVPWDDDEPASAPQGSSAAAPSSSRPSSFSPSSSRPSSFSPSSSRPSEASGEIFATPEASPEAGKISPLRPPASGRDDVLACHPERSEGSFVADTDADSNIDDEPETSAFDRIPAIVEARLIASLNDPNIVTVYDCQESDGRAYIIMEFVDGLTLAELLEKLGDDITLDQVAAIFAAVTGALEAAHSHNVLHLDIKPENVLIDRTGQVKVTDFGLATLADASGHGHAAAGTIGYMPPEQLRRADLDVRTDEWAVAALTYEMLTGTNQFVVDDLKDALPAIEDSELPVPSQMWDEAGDDLDDVLFTGLDIDPEDRYPTVEEFAQALLPQLGSVRKGKKQLAAAVVAEDVPELEPEPEPEPAGPVIPLVDRIGPDGAQLLVRILSALCCGGCAALAMMNFHAFGASSIGLAADAPFVFWPLLFAATALAAVRPTFGALMAPLFLTVSFFANGAFLLALGFGALSVAWWIYFCRDDEGMALCALLEPIFGTIGMGAAAPLLAGGLLSVGRAAICAAYNALFALVMACLGSCTLLGWNLAANSHFTINMESVFVNVIQRPETWVIALSWVAAAAAFSLFCARGTRFFDLLGSCVGAAIVIAAGWLAGQLAFGFDPLSIAGCILPGAFAVILALLGVPDRARRDPQDWEELRNL